MKGSKCTHPTNVRQFFVKACLLFAMTRAISCNKRSTTRYIFFNFLDELLYECSVMCSDYVCCKFQFSLCALVGTGDGEREGGVSDEMIALYKNVLFGSTGFGLAEKKIIRINMEIKLTFYSYSLYVFIHRHAYI